jgi:hypothetical protein
MITDCFRNPEQSIAAGGHLSHLCNVIFTRLKRRHNPILIPAAVGSYIEMSGELDTGLANSVN